MLSGNLFFFLSVVCVVTSGLELEGDGFHALDKKGDKVTVPESTYEELRIFCHKGTDFVFNLSYLMVKV